MDWLWWFLSGVAAGMVLTVALIVGAFAMFMWLLLSKQNQ